MTPSEQHTAGADSATELLARRTQLQEWLAKLDEVGGDIPAQVARRVRADYEQRLSAVVAELSAHTEALAADREQLDERLLAAAERHDAAADALEEARLRHRIGELSDGDWESRRPGLETDLEAAAAERAETEREIAALEGLFAQISASPAGDDVTLEAGAPPRAAEVPQNDGDAVAPVSEFAAAAQDWDPDLPVLEENRLPSATDGAVDEEGSAPTDAADAAETEEPAGAEAGGDSSTERVNDDLVEITNFAAAAEALAEEIDPKPADDDYAFLEELDRAIAATSPSLTPADEEEPSAETRPQPGLKCPDCGYSNDPAAWYCGVCGVDLG